MAPRSSNPTTWNEFLPISMPITAIALLRLWDMACSFVFGAPCQIRHWRGAGARPDHPISRREQRLGVGASARLPQRDHQPVEVGGDDQSRLGARYGQHCAVLVGQYDPARARANRDARAGSAIYAINVERRSDVADRADKIGR